MNGTGVRDTYNDMIERVRRLRPEARINGITVQQMARTARAARSALAWFRVTHSGR